MQLLGFVAGKHPFRMNRHEPQRDGKGVVEKDKPEENHICSLTLGQVVNVVRFHGSLNPGRFGMAQAGVPVGKVNHAHDWLKITGEVGHPPSEHPK
nr:single-strand selective monofunctional uracil DNA glycosylase-like [Oncorhynchus nerka]